MTDDTSLDAYYKKWDALAKALDGLDAADDDGGGGAVPPTPLGQVQPKDIGVTIGRPLTEEEFAAHRRRKGGPPPKVLSASAQ